MLGRRRRAVVGLAIAALVAAGWFAIRSGTAEGSEPPEAPVRIGAVLGSVDEAGMPIGSPVGWEVSRTSPGRYQLRFAAEVDLGLRAWEGPAAVTYRPTAPRTWLVDFTVGRDPVDTAFSFAAVPAT